MIWNKLITNGHCLPMMIIALSTGIFNLISDLLILLLPLHTVWNTHMPLKSKLAVSTVFAAGSHVRSHHTLPLRMLSNLKIFSAFVASVLRLYYNFRVTQFSNLDEASAILQVAIWTIAELGIGISCSCLPMAKKAFRNPPSQIGDQGFTGSISNCVYSRYQA